jgi:putative ABC transport system permease protein
VAGVVRRFPTVRGDAVVADRDLAVTALNASQPGTAVANEVWIRDSAPDALSALSREPFASLDVTTRAQVAERLKSDPLARAALLTLTAAALVGLALAVLGLVLGVVADLRDERGELLDLEGQGATPAALRRQVRLRTGLVAAVGLLGGAVTGAALSLLVVDLVRLTANAAAPEPPLVTQVSWPVIGLAVTLYAVLAGALVWLTTARAFRAAVPPTRAAEAAA